MKCVVYTEEYRLLLEKYFQHPDTPANNSNHKIFKTHLYDGKNGILVLLIDNDEIVAVCSAIIINENNVLSIKYPHRLNVRKDYSHLSNVFMNKFWEPLFFDWYKKIPIKNLYCAFNLDNYLSFMWSAVKHQRRLKNNYVDEFGKSVIARKWYIYPKLIMEMGCWQYIMFSNPTDDWFYPWRDTADMDLEIVNRLNDRFPFFSGKGWLV